MRTPIKDEHNRPAFLFPGHLNTVEAEVLAYLLSGERISQHDATRLMGTTRLAGIIESLRKKYGQDFILTEIKPCLTSDGRKSRYGEYHVPQSHIDRIPEAERATFCHAVKVARAALRQQGGW